MQPDTQPAGQDTGGLRPVQPVQPIQPIQPVTSQVPAQAPVQPVAPQPAQQQPVQPVEPASVEALLAEDTQPELQGGDQNPGDDQASSDDEYDDEAYGFDPEDDEYADEYDDDDEDDEIDLTEPVAWSAKEYIHQEKGVQWFIIFGVILAVLIGAAIFLMHSPMFALLLVVIGVSVVVLDKRPPREMDYQLSNDGLHIGETLHKFTDFKSFGVIHDGQEYSVMLIPRRRLQPGITVYFPEESGEDIVDALGSRLPMRELHLDLLDRLVRALRL